MDINRYLRLPGAKHAKVIQYQGFTLVEILIVLVMVAILTAIAYPSYVEQVRRGVLIEASELLTASKTSMDQFYLSKRSFAESANAGGPCVTKTGKAFQLTCTLDSSNSLNYLFAAAGLPGTRAAGFTYTINQAGVRTTNVVGLSGWPATASCWIFKKGDVC